MKGRCVTRDGPLRKRHVLRVKEPTLPTGQRGTGEHVRGLDEGHHLRLRRTPSRCERSLEHIRCGPHAGQAAEDDLSSWWRRSARYRPRPTRCSTPSTARTIPCPTHEATAAGRSKMNIWGPPSRFDITGCDAYLRVETNSGARNRDQSPQRRTLGLIALLIAHMTTPPSGPAPPVLGASTAIPTAGITTSIARSPARTPCSRER
jgi:hypothetical protein